MKFCFPSKMSWGSTSSDGGYFAEILAVLEDAAATAELRQRFGCNFLPAACGPPCAGQTRARCSGNTPLLPLTD